MDIQLVCTDLGRRAEVRTLMSKALGRRETDDGVIVEFPSDDATAQTLLEFVLAERQCCAKFTYELVFSQGLALRLRASGLYLVALKAMYA